ncbi:MAG TPA: hypothetical protein VG796_25260 [Verrucomicrobiales bacterium]|nr:hypothetical protein [Verrucomicrobiales bacterium]
MKTSPLRSPVVVVFTAAFLALISLLAPRAAQAQTFADAADSTGITWSQTGTGRAWRAVNSSASSHDGVDMLELPAAGGGLIPVNTLQATLTGPGVLTYWICSGQYIPPVVEAVSGGQVRHRETLWAYNSVWRQFVLHLPRAASYTIKWDCPTPENFVPGLRMDEFIFTPAAGTIADAVDAPLAWTMAGGEPWLPVTNSQAADGVDYLYGCAPANSQASELTATVTGPAWIDFKWRGGDINTYEGTVQGKKSFLRNGTVVSESTNFNSYWTRERYPLPPGDNVLTWRVTPGQTSGALVFLDQVVVQPVADGVSLETALDNDGSWTLGPGFPQFIGRSAPGLGRNDNDAAVTELGTRRLPVTVNGRGTLSGWARLRKTVFTPEFSAYAVGNPSSLIPYNYWASVPNDSLGPWFNFNLAIRDAGATTVSFDLIYSLPLPLQQPAVVPELYLDELKFTPDVPAESVSLPNITLSVTPPGSWSASLYGGERSFHPFPATLWIDAPGAIEFTVTGPGDFTCRGGSWGTSRDIMTVDGIRAGIGQSFTTIHVPSGVHRIQWFSALVVAPVFTPGRGIAEVLDMPEMIFMINDPQWEPDTGIAHDGASSFRMDLNAFESQDSYSPIAILPQPGTLSWWSRRSPEGTWTKTEVLTSGAVSLRAPFYAGSNQSLWIDGISFTPLSSTLVEVKAASGVADITASAGIAFIPGGFADTPVARPIADVIDDQGGYRVREEWVEIRTPGPGRLSFRVKDAGDRFHRNLRIDGLAPNVTTEAPDRWRPVKIDLPGTGQHVVRMGVETGSFWYPGGFTGFVDSLSFDPNVRDIGAAVGLGSVPWLTSGEATAEVVNDPSATGGKYAVFQVIGYEDQPGATWSAPGHMPSSLASARVRYRYSGIPLTSLTLSTRALPWASGQWLAETFPFLPSEPAGFLGRSTTNPSFPLAFHVDDMEYSTWSSRTLAEALDAPGITWQTNITLSDPVGGEVYPPTGIWEPFANSMMFTDGDGVILRDVQTQDFLGGRAALLKGTVSEPGTLTYWWRMAPRASDTFSVWGPAGSPPRSETFARASAQVGTFFNWNARQSAIPGPNDIVYLDRVRFTPDSIQTSFTAWSTALLPGTPDPNRDHDGDTFTDFLEYAFDGYPDDPSESGYPPVVTLTSSGNNTTLRLTWRQRRNSTLTYTPELTSTLTPGTWTPAATAPALVQLSSLWDAATLTITYSPGASRLFARVRVSGP